MQDETNFYESLNQFYEDLVFFGTGVVLDYEDQDDIFVCRNPCAGQGEVFSLSVGSDNADQTLFVEGASDGYADR